MVYKISMNKIISHQENNGKKTRKTKYHRGENDCQKEKTYTCILDKRFVAHISIAKNKSITKK